jgi:RND family efflux transporter MFP subunit
MVAAALIMIVGLGFYRSWRASNAPIDINAVEVRRAEIRASFTADGVVKGKTVDLTPKIIGIVRALLVAEGDRVRTGQELVRLENDELRATLREAEAAAVAARLALARAETAATIARRRDETDEAQAAARLAAAQARYAQVISGGRPQEIAAAQQQVRVAEVTLAVATRAARRAQELFAAGGIARADLDDAEARYEVAAAQHRAALEALDLLRSGARTEERDLAKAEVDAAQAQLAAARIARQEQRLREVEVAVARAQVAQVEAGVSRARAALTYTVITAPFDGVVSRMPLEVGQLASPAGPAITLIDPNEMWVSADIADEDASKVRVGLDVVVTAPSLPGRRLAGRIAELAPQAEMTPDAAVRTRIVRIKVSLGEGLEALRPGLEVDVEGEAVVVSSAIVVPSDAIVLRESRTIVFVVEGGVARERDVRTGYVTYARTEAIAGLRDGEIVVTRGKERLVDGRRVRIVNSVGD